MKVYPNVTQGSEEWFAMRKGIPTASQFSNIITAVTGQLSAGRHKYFTKLIAECFCPEWQTFVGNKATDRGTEMEPEAREAFATHTGLTLQQVGFCLQENGVVGCSPDSLIVGPDGEYIGGLEIKCPYPETHIDYVVEGGLPDAYKQQVHGSMAVTGLNVWHFWSYFPGLRPHHVIVHRDAYTAKVEAAIDSFLIEYAAVREKVIPLIQTQPC